jgi:hypothetical protein
MKKLIAFFLVAALVSCSNEDQTTQSVDAVTSTKGSVLDGKVLSFKDNESFIKEYSDVSMLSGKELQNWISNKKLVSLLNTTSDSLEMQDDVISESRLIYSNALKSILNSESKVKIGGKVLWLNERQFYLLSENQLNKTSNELLTIKNDLEVYGQLLSKLETKESLTGRNVIPNENRIKTFASAEMNVSGSRLRHVVDVFNETIVLNDNIQSSKMYLRSTLQYRSCSTFRCTWKEASNVRNLSTDLYCAACGNGAVAPWALASVSGYGITGTQTYLLGQWTISYVLANPYANFAVSGPVTCQVAGGSVSMDISWY